EENAAMTRRILEGHNGASREIALLNAGAGIFVSGKTPSIKEGIALARQVIDNGKAKKKLQEWIDATNS
ncbi:MAG: anthranilate phosphoribosyltransferase, partial [Bacteroidota bacterium]